MQKPKIFELKNGELALAKDEILLVPEFSYILKRDRGSQGDAQGRKKLRAYQEFHYVYLIADYESPCNKQGMTDKEAHEYAIKEIGLPEGYKPDEHLYRAIEKYRKLIYNLDKEAIESLLRIFRRVLSRIGNIDTFIQDLLDRDDATEDQIDKYVKYQKELFNLATDLPKYIERLSEAITKVKLTETSGDIARGGGEVPDSYDPDKSL